MKEIDLKARWPHVPIDANGDPVFKSLDDVLDVFSRLEVVKMVNRHLYLALAQSASAKKSYRLYGRKDRRTA